MSEKHNYTATDAFDAVTDRLNIVIASLACEVGSEDSEFTHHDHRMEVVRDQVCESACKNDPLGGVIGVEK